MELKMYHVWFYPEQGYETCCVAVIAEGESNALELANEKIADFPSLIGAQYQVKEFELSFKHAEIC